MARPRVYGEKERTKMRELHRQGLTPNRIAYLVGCSEMTVRRDLYLPPYNKPKDAVYLMTMGYSD